MGEVEEGQGIEPQNNCVRSPALLIEINSPATNWSNLYTKNVYLLAQPMFEHSDSTARRRHHILLVFSLLLLCHLYDNRQGLVCCLVQGAVG